MNEDQFLTRHGDEFRKLRRKQMFTDLLETLREVYDPVKATPGLSAQDTTDYAPSILGRLAGFQLALNALKDGFQEPIQIEPPEVTYETPEE